MAPTQSASTANSARAGLRDPANAVMAALLGAGFLSVFFRFLLKQAQFSRKFPAD